MLLKWNPHISIYGECELSSAPVKHHWYCAEGIKENWDCFLVCNNCKKMCTKVRAELNTQTSTISNYLIEPKD